jgi:hypothetical protein
MDKNGWIIETFNSIAWRSHGNALNQLIRRKRKTIIQLLHDWLPVNTSHSLQLIGEGRICPLCNTQEERMHHILLCNQIYLTDMWKTSVRTLK